MNLNLANWARRSRRNQVCEHSKIETFRHANRLILGMVEGNFDASDTAGAEIGDCLDCLWLVVVYLAAFVSQHVVEDYGEDECGLKEYLRTWGPTVVERLTNLVAV